MYAARGVCCRYPGVVSEYTDALRALNDAEDEWHERDRQIRKQRGVPDDIPLVVRDADAELMEHKANLEDINRRWAEFNATYSASNDKDD